MPFFICFWSHTWCNQGRLEQKNDWKKQAVEERQRLDSLFRASGRPCKSADSEDCHTYVYTNTRNCYVQRDIRPLTEANLLFLISILLYLYGRIRCRVYMVPKQFVENWRNFVTPRKSTAPPESIGSAELLCTHGLLKYECMYNFLTVAWEHSSGMECAVE